MNRNQFLKTAALASAAGLVMPKFSFGAAMGSDKIKVAIVGCGGRGTGALQNMLAADKNIEFVAAGDIYMEQIQKCGEVVSNFAKRLGLKPEEVWKVKPDTSFVGLDAIDKVLQTNADVVALVTPPVFRTLHIEKALNAGKHIFAEKPICVDPVQLRKIYNELIPLADKKGLSVLCGTQMRYQSAIQEAIARVRDGQIGDITSVVCLRYEPEYLTGWYDVPKNLVPEDVRYQLLRWLAFTWTSGDQYVEQYIHNLDLALWAINEMPTEVIGSGGRQTDIPFPELGNRQSNTHAHFSFASGISLTGACRQEKGTSPYCPLKVYGTKGTLDMTFERQTITGEKPWKSDAPKNDAVVCEHEALFKALRSGTHFNTMKQCADSCFVAICGREASYAGKRIKTAWFREKSKQSLLPKNLSLDGKLPIAPVPNPTNYKLV